MHLTLEQLLYFLDDRKMYHAHFLTMTCFNLNAGRKKFISQKSESLLQQQYNNLLPLQLFHKPLVWLLNLGAMSTGPGLAPCPAVTREDRTVAREGFLYF